MNNSPIEGNDADKDQPPAPPRKVDHLAELREVIDDEREFIRTRANAMEQEHASGFSTRRILAVGFALVLELALEIRDRLPALECQNCQDCGRVSSGPIPGRATPLVNYCPKNCLAAQRELLRDRHVAQMLNPQDPRT